MPPAGLCSGMGGRARPHTHAVDPGGIAGTTAGVKAGRRALTPTDEPALAAQPTAREWGLRGRRGRVAGVADPLPVLEHGRALMRRRAARPATARTGRRRRRT